MESQSFKKLPESEIRDFIQSLYLKNRVHNSDDFEFCLHYIQGWLRKNGFRGQTRLIKFASGSEHNFWRVPKRWHIRKFELRDSKGGLIHLSHPLSVVPYSESFIGTLTKDELLKHLHTREDLPEAYPYIFRKMYRHWEKGWGIAMPYELLKTLNDSEYHLHLETELTNEPMPMLEYTVSGSSKHIIGLSAHLDHPGQFNDGLGGVLASLAALWQLEKWSPNLFYSYSILICPEIIGSAIYLKNEPDIRERMLYCLCPNMLAHDAPFAMCLSKSRLFQSTSALDKSLFQAIAESGTEYKVGLWREYPDCGDEVSYDAPGYEIPTTTFSRLGEDYKYYHTSFDSPENVSMNHYFSAIDVMTRAFLILENDFIPVRCFEGNPGLSNPKLNLYLEPLNVSNQMNVKANLEIRLLRSKKIPCLRSFIDFFISNLEGKASLLDIADASDMPFEFVKQYAEAYLQKGLIFSKGKIAGRERSMVMTSMGQNLRIPIGLCEVPGEVPGEVPARST